MSHLWTLLRPALRALRRSPGYAATVVLMLALGLGLCSFMFSALNAYFLRPLPFAAPEELVHLEHQNPALDQSSLEVTAHDFLDWRRDQRSFRSLEAFSTGTVNLSDGDRPERYDGGFVTAGAFAALGVRPQLGRGFQAGDDGPGAPPVVVLSHDLWVGRYGTDAGMVGRTIRVNGKPAEVVGVMPPGFRFPFWQDVWVPADLDVGDVARGEGGSFEVFGRLRPDRTLAQARADLAAIDARLAQEFPATNAGLQPQLKPLAEEYIGPEKVILGSMLGAVVLVLLIACANVANLVLARAAVRARELAIRSALGGSRRRIALELAAETALLGVIGAALGFALARRAAEFTLEFVRRSDDSLPYWVRFAVDWRDFAFLALAVALAAVLAGLLPALRTLRGDLMAPIRAGGGGTTTAAPQRMSGVLVATQVTLCCVLLVGAGLMVRSVLNVARVELGADAAGVLSGRVGLFEEVYPEPADRVRLYEAVLERLRAVPGVSAATIGSSIPGSFIGRDHFLPEGEPEPADGRYRLTGTAAVAPEYFATLRIPLLRGREFSSGDRLGTLPVAVVNRAFARRVWGAGDPIGRRVRLGRPAEEGEWLTVVGLVGDALHGDPEEGIQPVVYRSLQQAAPGFVSLVVRTAGDPLPLAEPMRRAVAAADPDLPVYWIRTLDEWVRLNTFGNFIQARLFGAFGGIGFALAAVGLYAVLAFAVAQRTREIGVRRALGARAGAVARLVLRQALKHALIGLAVGLPAAVGFGKLLAGQLVGVEPFDPATFAVVLGLITLVTAIASLAPLRRALRVDPLRALRQD